MTLNQLFDFSSDNKSEAQSKLSQRVVELDQYTLQDIMTPRSIVTALDADVQLRRVRRLKSSKAAYFPVYEGDLDNVIGWISKDKIMELLDLPPDAVDLRKYVRPVGRIPDTTPVSQVADLFLESRSPFLVVSNAQNQTVGIVMVSEFAELLFGFELEAKPSAVDTRGTETIADKI